MKSLIVILLSIFIAVATPSCSFAQNNVIAPAKPVNTDQQLADLKQSYDAYVSASEKKNEALADRISKIEKIAPPWGRKVHACAFILCLSPIILFVLFFMYTAYRINFKEAVREALSDKGSIKSVQVTSAAAVAPAPENTGVKTTTNEYPKSASRMALFFSSAASIILALCFSSVFFYSYLKYNTTPDYSSLVQILLSLGIGVIPYAVNQFNKPDPKQNTP